jgi:MFS superfamily sulfate permease-like transporter
MALMTQKYVTDHGPEYAFILCFSTGVIVLLFGLLNLGGFFFFDEYLCVFSFIHGLSHDGLKISFLEFMGGPL